MCWSYVVFATDWTAALGFENIDQSTVRAAQDCTARHCYVGNQSLDFVVQDDCSEDIGAALALLRDSLLKHEYCASLQEDVRSQLDMSSDLKEFGAAYYFALSNFPSSGQIQDHKNWCPDSAYLCLDCSVLLSLKIGLMEEVAQLVACLRTLQSFLLLSFIIDVVTFTALLM